MEKRKSSTSLGATEASLSDQDFAVTKSSSKQLFDGKWAYHVTNCRYVDESSKPPTIDRLNGSMATDTYYDGALLGAAGVFFTTSLYYNKKLPTISPYPTNGKEGEKYWRVKVPLDEFSGCDMSFVKKDKSQVMLLLTRGMKQTAQFRVDPGIIPLNPEDNEYLCRKNGDWRVSAYEWNASSDSPYVSYFVNFFLPGNFVLKLHDVEWDTVTRGKQSTRDPMPPEDKVDLHNELWLAKALLCRNKDQEKEYNSLCKTRFSMRTPSSRSLN